VRRHGIYGLIQLAERFYGMPSYACLGHAEGADGMEL